MRINLFSTRPWRTETLKRWDIIHHGMSQQQRDIEVQFDLPPNPFIKHGTA
jgi:hypothetical protein